MPTVGIGWRQPHFSAVLEQRPAVDFLEVHSENFFAAGGATRATLRAARALYPISLHGVGLGLGSVTPPGPRHVDRLAALVDEVDPLLVSEHLCWSSAGGWTTTDLLPLPLTEAALDLMSARVDALQRRLGRRIAVENISAYLRPAAAAIAEPEFLNRLATRTGCGILLDINNAYVNACNFAAAGGPTAEDYVDAIDAAAVTQVHLAGHERLEDCVVDTHGATIADPVWTLFRRAVARIGPRPTLIERDTAIPPLADLLAEADRARREIAAAAPCALAA